MARPLQMRVTVQAGGKIEIESPELTVGEDVDVTIAPAKNSQKGEKRSIVDILAEAPGHLLFKSAEEVDEYIREERASWGR